MKTARLTQLFELCPHGARVADVGTDHALLPIALVQAERARFAIAADLRRGPLEGARENIARAQLAERITVRLGDGLAPLHPEDHLDVIIIAGMGPRTIREILVRGDVRRLGARWLIVQSPQDARLVREYIWQALKARIQDEVLLAEDDQLYHTLVVDLEAEPARDWEALSQREQWLGPRNLARAGALLDLHIARRVERLMMRLGGMQQARLPDEDALERVRHELTLLRSPQQAT